MYILVIHCCFATFLGGNPNWLFGQPKSRTWLSNPDRHWRILWNILQQPNKLIKPVTSSRRNRKLLTEYKRIVSSLAYLLYSWPYLSPHIDSTPAIQCPQLSGTLYLRHQAGSIMIKFRINLINYVAVFPSPTPLSVLKVSVSDCHKNERRKMLGDIFWIVDGQLKNDTRNSSDRKSKYDICF